MINRTTRTTGATTIAARPLTDDMFDRRGISFTGVVAFLLSFSLVGSGINAARFDFAGLSVHPYLLIVGLLSPILFSMRHNDIPGRLLGTFLLFSCIYFASTFAGGVAVGEAIKIGAVVVTVLTMVMLVDRYADFEMGAMGMIVATSLLSGRALTGEIDLSQGIEAFEASNRNTYSLYALPAILLAGQCLLSNRPNLLVKAVLIVGVLVSSLTICLNLNRSGWGGLALIVVMLFARRLTRGLAVVAVIGCALLFLISNYYQTDHLNRRLMESRDNQSDKTRFEMIRYSFKIALENPLLGVSPRILQNKIANHFGYESGGMATHNVYAYLAGGSGLICICLLFYIGKQFWTYPLRNRITPRQFTAFKEARSYLRMVLTLWLFRGLFSHEILFSPGFCMAIGLCAGLCKAAIKQLHRLPNARSPLPSMRSPSVAREY